MDQFVYGLSTPDGGKSFDLDLFSDIGEGGFFSMAKSANIVRQELLAAPQAKTIRLRVNSRGGDVFEAVAMHALLVQHPARVEAIVMGVAASAATIPMLAAEEVSIVEQGLVMIHDVWGGAKGSPDDLRDWADVLEKVNGSVTTLYAKRTKKTFDEVAALMAAETWMTADEAKAAGFVDKIIALKTPDAKKAKAFAFAMARDLSKAPKSAVALLQEPTEPAALTDITDALSAGATVTMLGGGGGGGGGGRSASETNPEPPPAPPAPAPAPQLQLALEPSLEAQEKPMKAIILALAAFVPSLKLTEESDEAAVVAGIKKLGASARVGADIEALLGVDGQAALGAVRALKETNEQNASLGDEVEKLKVVNARRDFESARDQGLKDKKLSPAVAKLYTERFEKAVKADVDGVPAGDGSDVVADLRGFLSVAPRLASAGILPREGGGGGSSAAQHDGKAFEDMTPAERLKLKGANLDLYNTLREDAQARGAL